MKLEGLKINFLGDSITEGHGTSGQDKRFTSIIADEYGAVCRNYGIGGTRIARQKKLSQNERHDKDFMSRVEDMESDADLIVVFGGTNDFGHGDAAIGTPFDRGEYTFYGALHVLYTSLINKYPESKIVILTPIHRTTEDQIHYDGEGNVAGNLKSYVDIIKEVAEFYSLPVLDLYAAGGLQPRVPVIKEKYVPDGLHPNDAGHRILAEKIVRFIENL